MRNLSDSLKLKSLFGAIFTVVSLSAMGAEAQEPSHSASPSQQGSVERTPAQAGPSARPEIKKTLSFEDELVEGSTQKPELFYLFQKKNFNYKRLIKLRENFLPEMRKTSEDLQRVRSSN